MWTCSSHYAGGNVFQPQVGDAVEFGRRSTRGTIYLPGRHVWLQNDAVFITSYRHRTETVVVDLKAIVLLYTQL